MFGSESCLFLAPRRRCPELQKMLYSLTADTASCLLSTWPLNSLRLRHISETPICHVSSTLLLYNHQTSVDPSCQLTSQFIVSTVTIWSTSPVAPHSPVGYRTSGTDPFSSTFLTLPRTILKDGLMSALNPSIGVPPVTIERRIKVKATGLRRPPQPARA